MFAKAGISLADLRAKGLGSVVATMTIDFHHEMTAGQLTLVTGAFARVGNKSYGYELRLYESDSMTHCATQKTVEVCFDTKARKSAAFPDDVRATLAAQVAG
jgi:acyl-CoA thioesterase FadM